MISLERSKLFRVTGPLTAKLLSPCRLSVCVEQIAVSTQTVYLILVASKGWIKQTCRKIMHTQNHITGSYLVLVE